MFGCDFRVYPPKPSPTSEHTAMTNQQQHPITPPDELRRLWAQQAQRIDPHDPVAWMQHVSVQAAQWGADQELEACCEWTRQDSSPEDAASLRAARRPKPELPDHWNLMAFAFGREPWRTWLQPGGRLESAHRELSDLMLAVLAHWGRPATKPPEPPTDEERLADFTKWLAREMPPNTIIGDPLWWAPRIWCAALERWGHR